MQSYMQPIQLDKEQKDKLLEMAKYFFPYWTFANDSVYSDVGIIEYWKNMDDWHYIHWFEFLCFHLLTKFGHSIGSFFSYCQLYNNVHYIDVLYNLYKQLK